MEMVQDPQQFLSSLPERVRRRARREGYSPEEAAQIVSYVVEEGSPWHRWDSLYAGFRRAYRRGVKRWRECERREAQGKPPDTIRRVSLSDLYDTRDPRPVADVEFAAGVKGWPLLQEALDSLSEADRAIVMLHNVDGYTHNEIADLLGSTPQAVRQRHCRALQKLRDMLGVCD